MPNKRAQKRARTAARSDAQPATSNQPNTRSAAGANEPPSLPGFVWDPEKRRYFPAVSRAATAREQQHEERQRKHVEHIATVQKQHQNVTSQQSVPTLLRQRSTRYPQTPQWQRSTTDQLAITHMSKRCHKLTQSSDNSIVTALKVYANSFGERYMTVGHRDGTILTMELDAHDTIGQFKTYSNPGEISTIHHPMEDAIIYSCMGSGDFSGSVECRRWSSSFRTTTPIKDTSLFTMSYSPANICITALGISNGIFVGGHADSEHEPFHLRCKSDILSIVFADMTVGFGGGRDGKIRLFDTRVAVGKHNWRRGLLAGKECRHSSSVHALGMDGWRLASASMNGQVFVWDVRMLGNKRYDLLCANSLSGPSTVTSPSRLGFAVTRGIVAAASPDNIVRVWELHSGQLLRTVTLAPSADPCMALDIEYVSAKRPTLYIGQSSGVYTNTDLTGR